MRLVYGEGWRRVPAVTTGGKAYFYYRRVVLAGASVRQWVVWDRVLGQYVGTFERNPLPGYLRG
jgi:hypothetical protein